MANVETRRNESTFLGSCKLVQHTNTSSMSGNSTTQVYFVEIWAGAPRWRHDEERRAFERLGEKIPLFLRTRTDRILRGGQSTTMVDAKKIRSRTPNPKSCNHGGPFPTAAALGQGNARESNPMGRAPFSRNLFCRSRNGSGMQPVIVYANIS